MWKAQLGAKEIKTITTADDDDDWETDPDFVVRNWYFNNIQIALSP